MYKRAGIAAAAALSVVTGFGCHGGALYPLRDAAPEVTIDTGSVMVTGGFDLCPSVILQVTPITTTVGDTISISVRAPGLDVGAPDAGDGGGSDARPSASDGGSVDAPASAGDGGAVALSVSWTADSGSIADASAARTTFTCVQAGPVTIKANVSDGACVTSMSAAVYCLGRTDGGAGGAGGGGGSNGADGGGGMGAVNHCPDAEPTHGGAMCPMCTTDNCSLGPTGTDGCCGLSSGADQVLCQALVTCFAANASSCALLGDPTNCFCGNSGGLCFMVQGKANGPCVGEVVAAAKTTIPAAIQGQFSSPASPLGRAFNLLQCWGGFCPAECAVPAVNP